MFEVDWDKVDKIRKQCAENRLAIETYSKMIRAVLKKEAFTKKGEPRVYMRKRLENVINKAIAPASVKIEENYDIDIRLCTDNINGDYIVYERRQELLNKNGTYNLDAWLNALQVCTQRRLNEIEGFIDNINHIEEISANLTAIKRAKDALTGVSWKIIEVVFGQAGAMMIK